MCTEIEARDACYWLLAAGFPQYVQLYEGKPDDSKFFYDLPTDLILAISSPKTGTVQRPT